jgi:hypothetical protein
MNIFVVNNGKETGPLTADEVKELISSSNLKPDDPAVLEGAAEWSTVADVLRQSVGPGVAVSAEGGGGVQPMASVTRDIRNLKRNSSTTAGELREFMREMRGKSPREMLGAVAQSTLVQSTIVSTIAIFILLLLLTAVPYAMDTSEGNVVADVKKPDGESGTLETKSKTNTEPTVPAAKPDEKKTVEVLGVGGEKKGKPKEINPFENKKGGLFDDPLGGLKID